MVPRGFLIGSSTDDPPTGRRYALAGADYLGVGAVFETRSKPGLEHESIGAGRVAEVAEVAGIPCVGIGGIMVGNAAEVAQTGAGIAVLSAVMDSPNPGEAVAAFRVVLAEVR